MFNFDNIGKKICSLAKVFFVLGIVAAIFSALVSVFAINTIIVPIMGAPVPFWVAELIGVLVFFAAILGAWISNFCLYGYGQLISDTAETKDLTAGIYDALIEATSEPAPKQTNNLTDEEKLKRIKKLNEYLNAGQISQEQYNSIVRKLMH